MTRPVSPSRRVATPSSATTNFVRPWLQQSLQKIDGIKAIKPYEAWTEACAKLRCLDNAFEAIRHTGYLNQIEGLSTSILSMREPSPESMAPILGSLCELFKKILDDPVALQDLEDSPKACEFLKGGTSGERPVDVFIVTPPPLEERLTRAARSNAITVRPETFLKSATKEAIRPYLHTVAEAIIQALLNHVSKSEVHALSLALKQDPKGFLVIYPDSLTNSDKPLATIHITITPAVPPIVWDSTDPKPFLKDVHFEVAVLIDDSEREAFHADLKQMFGLIRSSTCLEAQG